MTSIIEIGKNLPLLDASDTGSGGCRCGGCGCATASTTTTAPTEQETVMTVPTDSQAHTRSYSVAGMTCSHCVASVTEELQEVPGVDEVNVHLVAGGTSTVTVTSTQPLDDDAVQAAVEEAGYQLA